MVGDVGGWLAKARVTALVLFETVQLGLHTS